MTTLFDRNLTEYTRLTNPHLNRLFGLIRTNITKRLYIEEVDHVILSRFFWQKHKVEVRYKVYWRTGDKTAQVLSFTEKGKLTHAINYDTLEAYLMGFHNCNTALFASRKKI